ncbi:hypothetical protein HDU91_002754, partial [Kappamyces sp. JEL0680]
MSGQYAKLNDAQSPAAALEFSDHTAIDISTAVSGTIGGARPAAEAAPAPGLQNTLDEPIQETI